MHARIDLPPQVHHLLTAQAGVISRGQLQSLGMGDSVARRLLAQRLWRRVFPGIYADREPTWEGWSWAGLLRAGPRAVLGFEAAGYLWGWRPRPREIVIWSPAKFSSEWPCRFRQGERAARGCPERTTREDTILDLWPELGTDERMALVGKAVSDGVRPASVLESARSRGRLAGRRELLEMLGDAAAGATSVLERLYLRDVARAHALPTARRQCRRGRSVTDCEYVEFALVVELDGRLGHSGEGSFRDMARDNRHLVEGLSTLRFGYADVRGDPCGVAAQVATVLRHRGWQGMLHGCRRCRQGDARGT